MIKTVREFYGIPQSLFADYLKISRSQLSMAEGSQRRLPADALKKIVKLHNAISKSEDGKDNELKKSVKDQNLKRKELVKSQLVKYKTDLAIATRTLNKMQDEQSRALRALASLPRLRKSSDKLEKGLLDIIEADARKRQRLTGLDRQLKWELRIKRLETEIVILERF